MLLPINNKKHYIKKKGFNYTPQLRVEMILYRASILYSSDVCFQGMAGIAAQ